MSHPCRAALSALIGFALVPAGAEAAVVAHNGAGTELAVSAAPGERNRLHVARVDQSIVVRDVGGLVLAASGPGCAGGGTAVVSCAVELAAPNTVTAVTVDLGDGDDELAVDALGGIALAAAGGPGDDRLDAAATAGFAELSGGSGADHLVSGRGESELTGGPDADVLAGGPAGAQTTFLADATADGADVLHGGPGFEVAAYTARTAPLSLTADGLADDGAAGEGDFIGSGVDGIHGGAAADVIAGASPAGAELMGFGGDDRVTGGPGDDLLVGDDPLDDSAGGADVLDGGAGIDQLRAGPGDDAIAARDGAAEAIACGAGEDEVAPDRADALAGCEQILPAGADARAPDVAIAGIGQRVRWRQLRRGLRPLVEVDEPATVVAELRLAGGELLARRTVRVTTARRITLRPQRAQLGRRRALRIRLRVTATDAAGNAGAVRRSLAVRR